MEYIGLIKGFDRYSDEQMERMKQDLHISLSLPMLRYCASYYKMREKRDPSIRELQLLDRYASLLAESPRAIALSDFATDDKSVADTYADMIEKRRTLSPNATTPVTVAELSELINPYLARVGKPYPLRARTVLCEDTSLTGGSLSGGYSLSASNSDFCIRRLLLKKEERMATDCFVLFTPIADVSAEDDASVLTTEVLENAELLGKCKEIRMIDSCGLLVSLLDMADGDGAWIELTTLAVPGAEASWRGLTDAFCGGFIARVSQADQRDVDRLAAICGAKARVFGNVIPQARFVFAAETVQQYSFECEFLRTFLQISPVRAIVEGGCEALPSREQCKPSQVNGRYVQPMSREDNYDTVAMGGQLFACATAHPGQEFFYSGFYTAFLPVLTLALSGCPYTEQTLGLGYKLPSLGASERRNGEILATLLGVYRLQAELGIPAADCRLSTDASAAHPSVTAFAFGTGVALPNTFVGDGTVLSVIGTDFGAGHLPEMSVLRSLLSELSLLRRKGCLLSARVLIDETPADAIQEMAKTGFSLIPVQSAPTLDQRVPFAILLETTVTTEYPELGRIEQKAAPLDGADPTEADVSDGAITPPSLVWSERPELVIVSRPKDRHASRLAGWLTQRGATVSRYTDAPEQLGKLSRSILTARYVILCELEELPRDAHIQFALDTMLRAGGRILTVGAVADSLYPNGIPETVLRAICEK